MTILPEHPTTRFTPHEFAASPPEARGLARDDVRLLVARPAGITHAVFRDLADHLRPGDLVVVNTSATLERRRRRHLARPARGAPRGDPPARRRLGRRAAVGTRRRPLGARRRGGRPGDGQGPARGAPSAVPPPRLLAHRPRQPAVAGRGRRRPAAAAHRRGRPIAYGYLDRRYPLAAYQSVFAAVPGSAEMASAGRPFTDALLTRLVSRGVGVAPVTLHTGVSSQEAGEGPQPEWYDVPPATARLVTSTRAAGGRVVAVGTTVTRALESAVHDRVVAAGSGWTERVVTPARPPEVVDGLVTGWHDAEASHLLLVEAVAGAALAQAAYDAAVAERYRWHDFGDSALLLP